MLFTPNRPSRCIQRCTPNVGNRRRLYTVRINKVLLLRLLSLPGAVNTRPPASAVYSALADSRCAKVPEGSTFIFGDILTSLKHRVATVSIQYRRVTDRHTTTANTRASIASRW